jgi:hypothetical protein
MKTLLWVIVLAVIAGALYWYATNESPFAPLEEAGFEESAPPTTELPSGDDTSDASLELDLSSIETQIDAFGSDNSTVNESISDEPVAQASL